MRTTFRVLVMLALGAGTASANSADENLLASRLLADLVEITGVPALSLAVWQHGESLAEIAVGTVNQEHGTPAEPHHLFRIASVSKVVGAAMLAQLVQERRLDADAPLQTYLPGLPEQLQRITVRQLMAHTSGLPHYQTIDFAISSSPYDSAIDALETVGDRPLLFPPGSDYHYSSHGYTVAAAVYEAITGIKQAEAVQLYIEGLIGRESPRVENPTRRSPARSNLFERSGSVMKTIPFDHKSYTAFGGGMTATARDLAAFGDAILHSETISRDTRTLLFSPAHTSTGRPAGDDRFQVGFGWRIGEDHLGRTVYHHAGVTTGARSILILYPDNGLTVALLSNAAWTSTIDQTGFAIADAFLRPGKLTTFQGTRSFTGRFAGEGVAGNLSCGEADCLLDDQDGMLSNWLMRFNPGTASTEGWPAYITQTGKDRVLILATRIGIVSLAEAADGLSFSGTVGHERELTLEFAN